MRIYIKICEDDKIQLKNIEEELKNILNRTDYNIECFLSGKELLNSNFDKTDILILDLDLGEEFGIEIAKEIRNKNIKCEIIFLTALEEYSREGYKVNAYRYILKDDNMYLELEESFEEYIKELNNGDKKLKIDTRQGQYFLDIDEILYLEIYSRKVFLYTNDDVYRVNSTINEFEERLKKHNFYRCHKSYIINLKKVTKIEKSDAFIKNMHIPISKYKIKEFRSLLARTLGELI